MAEPGQHTDGRGALDASPTEGPHRRAQVPGVGFRESTDRQRAEDRGTRQALSVSDDTERNTIHLPDLETAEDDAETASPPTSRAHDLAPTRRGRPQTQTPGPRGVGSEGAPRPKIGRPKPSIARRSVGPKALAGRARNVPTRIAQPWPVWLPWVLVLVLLSALSVPLLTKDNPQEIAYPDFLQRAVRLEIRDAEFTNGTGRIVGHLKDGSRFVSHGPTELVLSDRVSLQNTPLRFRTASRGFVERNLTWLILIGLVAGIAIAQRRARRNEQRGVGRSRARLWAQDRPTTRFDDVAGYDEVKRELREIVDALRDPARYERLGAHSPKGTLIVGPPGTGKTLFARAVAGEAEVPFFSVTGSDFMEMFVGVGAARVRDLFRTARSMAPCIIFIDEIDGVGRKRGAGLGGGHDEREQTLNQLLAEIDGFEASTNVVLLAATNRPDVIDPALLRPGRFDRQVVVPLPSREERRPILSVHAENRRLAADVDLDKVADSTPGMSGADLANLLNEAALNAVRRHGDEITTEDIEGARDRVLLGAARTSLVLSDTERRTTAFHEAGHAVLAALLPHADSLHKVTIIPHGGALGVTIQLPDEDRHSLSDQMVRDRICVTLGGRCAERIVFGHWSTGAANDLIAATELAGRMVREWGMSDAIGPRAWGTQGQVFLGEDLVQPKAFADDTSTRIDTEVERILRDEQDRAMNLLQSNRRSLDAVAHALEQRETLDGHTVERLVAANK